MKGFQTNLHIGTKIGGGYFGEVFLAKDDLRGEVAVKKLTQRPGEPDGEWLARKDSILREGQLIQQATHDNVVRIFSAVAHPITGDIHLVMEYCDQGSLQKVFETGPMSLLELRKVATDVCFGLAAMHARDLLHRDIKPANLLRDKRGVGKLGDFGLVTDKIILGYASNAGYWDHLPPETWKTGLTSKKSDVWALGMTIYRLAHGLDWYSRSPRPQTLIPKGGFATKLPWLPHIPDQWRRFLRKMLRDDAASRFQDANQVCSALASLPVTPNWDVDVTPNKITWKRVRNDREIVATWESPAKNGHTWVARSEPLGSGRSRRLAGSIKETTYANAEKGLREFFSTQQS